jgi:hypothetical protein
MNRKVTRSHCRSDRPESRILRPKSLPTNQQTVNAALIEVSICNWLKHAEGWEWKELEPKSD